MAKTDSLEIVKEKEFVEKVVKINRVNKVVKGGKRLSFRAFVICGDQNGRVNFGLGKSKEVPVAIKKAIDSASKKLNSINLYKTTIPHQVVGKFNSAKVLIKPAKEGTGVIAGGAVKVMLEAVGIKNIVAKSLGSRNPINMAKATLDALEQLKSIENEERERNIKISFSTRKDEV